MSKDVNQNIIMTMVAVCLLALVGIVIFIIRGNSPCPDDIEIQMNEKKEYQVGEKVDLRVISSQLSEFDTYEWTSDDCQSSNDELSDFVFSTTGSKTITVWVNTDCTKTEYLEIIDTAEEESLEDIPVVVGTLSVSKQKACVGAVLKFEDASENASAWWWDFGGASTSAVQNPRHRYKKTGTYTVTRMLNGEEDLISELIVDIVKCGGDSRPKKTKATAKFKMEKSRANVGELIQFTDKTSPKANSWLWNFGDGYTSHERNPSHVYNYHGTYKVTLSVNGTGKNVTTKSINIAPRVVIDPPPIAVTTTPRKIITAPVATAKPVEPVARTIDLSSQLARTLKTKLREIAKSSDYELKTNIYYNDLLPIIFKENMEVKIVKNGIENKKSFYNYYNSLNIQGGQNITNVEVLDTKEGKVTALRVNEQ